MNSAQPKVDFKLKQAEFAAYIRDPNNNPKPSDVPTKRMEMYRELFFNNVEGFLSSNFPVLKKIHTEQEWHALSQDFFSKHKNETPYFSEIAEEFIGFLENERKNKEDFPFLLELAHYEWVEFALSIAQVEDTPIDLEFIASLAQQPLALSDLAWPLAYQYPVEQISPDLLPLSPPEQPTFLVVYRNDEHQILFLKINAITFRLLQIIDENKGASADHCLQCLAEESGHPDPQKFKESGLEILMNMAEKGVIHRA